MYSIQPVSPARYREVVHFVCREFVAGSVLHRALNIPLDEYTRYMTEPVLSLLAEDLSFVAVDPADDSICGCILAGEYLAATNNSGSAATPEFIQPVNALLTELDQLYRAQRLIEPGTAVLVDIAVISPEKAGQGIYTRLRNTVHSAARGRGYQVIVGELTSAATQFTCVEKFGHQLICEIPYKSFEHNGSYPFASITEPASIQLVEGFLR